MRSGRRLIAGRAAHQEALLDDVHASLQQIQEDIPTFVVRHKVHQLLKDKLATRPQVRTPFYSKRFLAGDEGGGGDELGKRIATVHSAVAAHVTAKFA